MEDRPKRTVSKPSRYQTTSSDEAPRRKRVSLHNTTTIENIDGDINDLRGTMEDSFTNNTKNTNYQHIPLHAQYHTTPSHTNTNQHAPLHAQYHTMPSHTNTNSHELSTSNLTFLTSTNNSNTFIHEHVNSSPTPTSVSTRTCMNQNSNNIYSNFQDNFPQPAQEDEQRFHQTVDIPRNNSQTNDR